MMLRCVFLLQFSLLWVHRRHSRHPLEVIATQSPILPLVFH